MTKYGLATLIEQKPDGYEFQRDNWPLHITQIDTFEIGLTPEDVSAVIGKVIAGHKVIIVNAVYDEMMGPNSDILVTRLELAQELLTLHTEIVDVLETAAAKFKRPFILRESYKPHVTVDGNRRIVVGDDIVINSISLIEKEPDANNELRRVYCTIGLTK